MLYYFACPRCDAGWHTGRMEVGFARFTEVISQPNMTFGERRGITRTCMITVHGLDNWWSSSWTVAFPQKKRLWYMTDKLLFLEPGFPLTYFSGGMRSGAFRLTYYGLRNVTRLWELNDVFLQMNGSLLGTLYCMMEEHLLFCWWTINEQLTSNMDVQCISFSLWWIAKCNKIMRIKRRFSW